uniref:Rhodanese domain-containing protein n=1 Tax=viral metagenome TaxID=1070528 RepID=A0A6C0ES95_9ZZZZ
MGNTQSINKINFEDLQYVLNNSEVNILINTLSEIDQDCLIPHTTNIKNEESLINKFIQTGNKNVRIIIYGRNCNDEKIYKKYNQLSSLGFNNIYIYTGGLFEWLMLQDIYGENEFPTTKKELDILKYKPRKIMNVHLLEY